jgi:hypothetical protein
MAAYFIWPVAGLIQADGSYGSLGNEKIFSLFHDYNPPDSEFRGSVTPVCALLPTLIVDVTVRFCNQ